MLALALVIGLLPGEILTAYAAGAQYVKVTSSTELTDGTYLIVYEGDENGYAFNGGLDTLG